MIINKIIKIINRQAQKVFVVAYMRSNCKALTGKILVFWIGGRLWVVVACDGGGAMDEVRLYLICNLH